MYNEQRGMKALNVYLQTGFIIMNIDIQHNEYINILLRKGQPLTGVAKYNELLIGTEDTTKLSIFAMLHQTIAIIEKGGSNA